VFIPSTILPGLDHAAQNSQQWVTPKLGLNSTRVKGFLARLMYLRQQEQLLQVPTEIKKTQSLIPHMHVPPQEVCPFSFQQLFDCPTFLIGLQQQAGQEFSEHCSYSWAPSGNLFPIILSPGESFSWS
jgi:hypothetical protein